MEKQELRQLIYDAICVRVDEETACRKADMAAELHEEMKHREVRFSFLKKDGSVRDAVGTLQKELLPALEEPKDGEEKKARVPNYSLLNYYDLEKQAWRSFKVENLVSAEI